LGEFKLGYVRLQIQSVRFVSFSILFFTLHTPWTHAHLPDYCLRCLREIYFTAKTKAKPASGKSICVDF